MSGTNILTGEGKLMIIVTGEQSCVGKIEASLVSKDDLTPLQIKLSKIADDIGVFGLLSAITIFFILIIRFIIEISIT